MITGSGLRVLEFNCRFGDPETQVVLPLLQTDLLDIILACVNGTLHEKEIRWNDGAAVSIVLASRGYPEKVEIGKTVEMGELPADTVCFHAGTRVNSDGHLLTSGGRVLAVTSWAKDIPAALHAAYTAVQRIHFEGMQYRHDIAASVLTQPVDVVSEIENTGSKEYYSMPKAAYEDSGVSIDAGNKAVELMKEAVRATYTPAVLAGIGSFGGLFDAASIKTMQNPVLVASTDGVGTKVKLAAQAARYRSIGYDIVNHCVNDILVQGAHPLFFMDYFATSKLNPEQAAEVVSGIADACKESGVVLLGGETAEMPGVYAPGEFDVAGTIVGVLERDDILPRSKELKAGDIILGLASSGPHTNGYSLIRKVFDGISLETVFPELGVSLADALLVPHRSYLKLLEPVLDAFFIKALAHLTGGGFVENIPRILPAHLDAEIRLDSWPVSPLWRFIQQKGNIADDEMYRVFNMGIGMVVIVEEADAAKIRQSIPETTWEIGCLVTGSRKVVFR
jgi:phosphoribosylaminoimidazole synthetase